ncbi:Tetratricopeptide-like helical [Corchorus capsularis]|uniref:Tetratricopeptide-like helical n=1 Tax=Corchorus capsularis TaxID=210143 RepID=A0A1R3G4P7_COCAP|nr:Tetratricopeptide-like helical [Corchorus capsularis]
MKERKEIIEKQLQLESSLSPPPYHVLHKLPPGDSPYVRAKHVQGNLGWAYMQQENYLAAEAVYRKAQIIDPDANKACNLCHCLIKQARYLEAQSILEDVIQEKLPGSSDPKSRNRVKELMLELESKQPMSIASSTAMGLNMEDAFLEGLDQLMSQWTPYRSRRLPIFEEISSFRDQLAC